MKLFNRQQRNRLARHHQRKLRKGLRLESLENRIVFSGASPVAVNDLYETLADEALVVEASGVLANDADAEGDPLTALEFSGPRNGQLELLSDGSFVYQPDPGFSGMDGFVYQVDDGTSQSHLAAVTIQVIAPNAAPVGENDAYSLDEDGVLAVMAESGVLINDLDPDGDEITPSLVDSPAHGTLDFNPDGSFTYLPDPDFNGTDAFTYTISDGELTSELVLVEITVNAVNDAPVATGESYTVAEDERLELPAPGLLENDTDVDGDPLQIVLDQGPANGTLELNADGSFAYTPNENYSGGDSFSYSVSDGTESSQVVLVEITVEATDDPPVVSNDFYTVAEDGVLEIPAAGVLANDLDPDGDPLSAELIDEPIGGSVEFNADGSFVYIPIENFSGTDAFTYRVTAGGQSSDLGVVEINVSAVNDAPIAVDDSYETDMDSPLIIAASGVLANDTDVEGDPLTATVETGPTNGTLELMEDGSFVYTPNAGFAGADGFTYLASDGQATTLALVSILVSPGELPPVAVNDSYQAVAGESLMVDSASGILKNDSDPNGDPLEAILFRGPTHGELILNADGSFEYVPMAEYSGIDSFIYRVSDGGLLSSLAVVTLHVQASVASLDDSSGDDDSGASLTQMVPLLDSAFENLSSDLDTELPGEQVDALFADIESDEFPFIGINCRKST